MIAFAGLSDIVTFIVGPFADTYTKLRELKVDHIDVRAEMLGRDAEYATESSQLALCSSLQALFVDHRGVDYLTDLKRIEEGGWLRKVSPATQ